MTERASPLQPTCYAAIARSHCQSDTITTFAFLRQHPCPLRRFAPAPPKWEPLACRSGPRPDEQSPIFRKQEYPAVKTNSSLTKCACPKPSTRPVPQRAREPDAFCRIPLYSDAFMLPLTYYVSASFYGHFNAFFAFWGTSKCTFPHFWSFQHFPSNLKPVQCILFSSFIIARRPSFVNSPSAP